MIANPDKFKAIIINKNKEDKCGIPLSINQEIIKCDKQVKLLSITIDNKLSLSNHISTICKR